MSIPTIRSLALGLAALVASCAPPPDDGAPANAAEGDTIEPPALVVLMVVDQLRADLLTRYDAHFTGGLRRLMDGGVRFENATHDHAVTSTAPGHATLATGVHPSRHGIPGNEFWIATDEGPREVYAVFDPDASILEVEGAPGRSPVNLKRDGIGQWVRAAHPEARIVAVSRKDRAAITLGGRSRGHVYWVDRSAGRFATSDYYRSRYPDWVVRFTEDDGPRFWADSVWNSRVPAEAASASRPDPHPHEGDTENTTFPHRAQVEIDHPLFEHAGYDSREVRYNRWIADRPVMDAAVLALARRAVTELELGRRDHPDFVALALSQTDLVGHDYGPLSREQLDNLLHLDRVLGEFLDFLDREVGRDRWVLAFSADHGIADLPEYTRERGDDAGRMDLDEGPLWEAALAAAEAAGRDSGGDGEGGHDAEAVARQVADTLLAFPMVRHVWTDAELMAAPAADSFATLYRNSRVPGRGPDLARFGVHVLLEPNWIDDADGRGSTHKSPYLYDRSVPLVFYGPGLEAGTRSERAATVDVAPTLAALAGIPAPDDLDGRVLLRRR